MLKVTLLEQVGNDAVVERTTSWLEGNPVYTLDTPSKTVPKVLSIVEARFILEVPIFVANELIRLNSEGWSATIKDDDRFDDIPIVEKTILHRFYTPPINRYSDPDLNEFNWNDHPPTAFYNEYMNMLLEFAYLYGRVEEQYNGDQKILKAILPQIAVTEVDVTASVIKWFEFVRDAARGKYSWETFYISKKIKNEMKGVFPTSWSILQNEVIERYS